MTTAANENGAVRGTAAWHLAQAEVYEAQGYSGLARNERIFAKWAAAKASREAR